MGAISDLALTLSIGIEGQVVGGVELTFTTPPKKSKKKIKAAPV